MNRKIKTKMKGLIKERAKTENKKKSAKNRLKEKIEKLKFIREELIEELSMMDPKVITPPVKREISSYFNLKISSLQEAI